MTITPEMQVIISILTIVSGFVINWFSNKNKIAELKLSQTQLEQKFQLDKEKADQEKRKSDADLSDQFLDIATAAGEQVISRDLTIKERDAVIKTLQVAVDNLQKSVATLNGQVTSLLVDKRKLEDESIRKDERISALELENQSLIDRVKLLEDEIKTSSALELENQNLKDRVKSLENEIKTSNGTGGN
jgi:chromosome segregation ATPase